MATTLRNYQNDVIEWTFDEKNINDNVLIVLPTGAGKTVIASEIIKRYRPLGFKTVFVTPRLVLIDQSAKKFSGAKVGIVQGSIDDHNEDCDVYICSKQTLQKRHWRHKFLDDKIVIIDEVHEGLERSKDLFFRKCQRIIGLTASPEKQSGAPFLISHRYDLPHDTDIFHKMYEPVTIPQLQSQGFLCPAEIVKPDYKKYNVSQSLFTDDEAIRKAISMNKEEVSDSKKTFCNDAYSLVVTIAKEKDVPTLIFCSKCEIGEKLHDYLKDFGYGYIDSKMSDSTRENVINDFKSKKIKGIINVGILTTGFDCEIVERVILFRFILSKSLFIQCIGRGLRPDPNNSDKKTEIVDIFNCYRLFKYDISKDLSVKWYPQGITQSEKRERRKRMLNDLQERSSADDILQKRLFEEASRQMYNNEKDKNENIYNFIITTLDTIWRSEKYKIFWRLRLGYWNNTYHMKGKEYMLHSVVYAVYKEIFSQEQIDMIENTKVKMRVYDYINKLITKHAIYICGDSDHLPFDYGHGNFDEVIKVMNKVAYNNPVDDIWRLIFRYNMIIISRHNHREEFGSIKQAESAYNKALESIYAEIENHPNSENLIVDYLMYYIS